MYQANISITRIDQLIKSIINPYFEDSIQDAWVNILDSNITNESDIIRIAKEINAKNKKQYVNEQYKIRSLDKTLTSHDGVASNTPFSEIVFGKHKKHLRFRTKARLGHFPKTIYKITQVINLYNQGYGIRPICSQLHLAKNTVRNIISESQPLVINLNNAELNRKARIKNNKLGIIPALKGLSSSSKKNNYSVEIMLRRSIIILNNHLIHNFKETITSLIGNNNFTIDDLINKTYEITITQYNLLMRYEK